MIPNNQIWFSNYPTSSSFMEATGGTIITDGNYKIHVFKANDNFQITKAHGTFEYLIVPGGGGGGSGYGGTGGGGGGGGVPISGTDTAVVGNYPIVIGIGGVGATAGVPNLNGTNGGNTTFYGFTTIGGGGGNTYDNPTSGSGSTAGGATFNGVSGTATSGHIGGIRTTGPSGGGGGGANASGLNGDSGGGGNGGDGIQSFIAGVVSYYGGGGAAAINDATTKGFGGKGGGGDGATSGGLNGKNGLPNTGGGGGGGYSNTGKGGDGGSGIVIIRYQYMAACYPNLNNAVLSAPLIDSNTVGYSTFQSHNQKVVSNANGVFICYVKTSNVTFTYEEWYLKKTTDGGLTFTSLYNNTSSQSAPCMETDSSNNLYLIVPTSATDATFYKFLASDYTTPSVTTTLVGLAQEKYTMALDETNNKIYFTSNSNKFVVLNMSGTIITSPYTFTQGGIYAVAEYPHLQLDASGTLYCAWTTHGGSRTYWNISWLKSTDFGVSWKKADGTALTLPIKVDTSGSCDMITRVEEVSYTTFLSSFMYANERLHAVYFMTDSTGATYQEYARINPSTGVVEIRTIQFLVCSPTQAGTDGFFIKPVVDGTFASPVPIYYITESNRRYLVSAVSADNGNIWKKTKVLDMNPSSGWRVYSVGGFRKLVDGNTAYGVFTIQDLNTPPYYQNGSGKTYFIKLVI